MRISDWSSDVCSSDLVDAEAIAKCIETMPGAGELLRGFFQCVDDRIFRPDVIDEGAFIAKEADVVRSVMDDKLGVTLQQIKNFGQFLFEGRRPLQAFVGWTLDGESLALRLPITWIYIALELQ